MMRTGKKKKANTAVISASAGCMWSYDSLGQVIIANDNHYTYDADGNQLTGLQSTVSLPERNHLTFVYNVQNRPIQVKQNGTALENYTYDHQGRRTQKGDTLTLYDGYNAIAEYNLNTRTLKTTYAWGNDLSGSLQNAGGVGGLLSVTNYTTQTPSIAYPAYDGNGNITEYLTEGNNGTLAAHYEYDAFGNVVRNTGEKEFTYQFSAKPFNNITGFIYYNYRDYDSFMGGWISRDHIGENGGINLYSFLQNNGIFRVDSLGLSSSERAENNSDTKIVKLLDVWEWDTAEQWTNPIADLVLRTNKDLDFHVHSVAVLKCDDKCNPSIEQEQHSLIGKTSSGIDFAVGSIGYTLTTTVSILNTTTEEENNGKSLTKTYSHEILVTGVYSFVFTSTTQTESAGIVTTSFTKDCN